MGVIGVVVRENVAPAGDVLIFIDLGEQRAIRVGRENPEHLLGKVEYDVALDGHHLDRDRRSFQSDETAQVGPSIQQALKCGRRVLLGGAGALRLAIGRGRDQSKVRLGHPANFREPLVLRQSRREREQAGQMPRLQAAASQI